MILGALFIGVVAAYHFGLEVGIVAAVVCGLLFVMAAVVPGMTVVVYCVVGIVTAGVCWLGPRMGKGDNRARAAMRRAARRAVSALWRRM